ncbi:MAG: hypothetical protein ACXVAU_11245 [Mucilaginibacter sp.]
MDKSEDKSTNKGKNEPKAEGMKPKNTVRKTVKFKADAMDNPGKTSAGSKTKNKKPNHVVQSGETQNSAPLVKQANPQNPLSETEMEVHHHPQLEHKPKHWKEYLLEGFMIFIAVMMGFIAENIRENISNSEHARQLISQLVQDLKTDTVRLNKIYAEEAQIVKSNDTLFNLLQQPLEKADAKWILKLVSNSHSMSPFHPSAGSIAAIKNELHLKQFSNSRIISYIAKYEGHIELLHTVQDITLLYQRSYLDLFLRLHFSPSNIDAAFSQHPLQNVQMRNLTQEDITQLGADMVLVRINSRELVRDNRLLKDDAVSLLQYITKQYQLEDE